MKQLISQIKKLKSTDIKDVVDTRMREFKNLGSRSCQKIFSELCFCLLTANFNAERSIAIQNEIGKGFSSLPLAKLKEKLKALGHRYPNARAAYIFEAQRYKDDIKDVLSSLSSDEKRLWLVQNIKGLGFKEASHFLRNIGHENLAIIDFHVIDLLVRHNLVCRPKSMTPSAYLEIEKVLKQISNKVGICLGELDLYLWYMETNQILK